MTSGFEIIFLCGNNLACIWGGGTKQDVLLDEQATDHILVDKPWWWEQLKRLFIMIYNRNNKEATLKKENDETMGQGKLEWKDVESIMQSWSSKATLLFKQEKKRRQRNMRYYCWCTLNAQNTKKESACGLLIILKKIFWLCQSGEAVECAQKNENSIHLTVLRSRLTKEWAVIKVKEYSGEKWD